MAIDRRRREYTPNTSNGGVKSYGESDKVIPLLVQRRTKYDDLDVIIPNLAGKCSELNLFFDLRSHVGKFFSDNFKDISNLLKRGRETIFCTEILNTMAHYRAYFWKAFSIKTNLILYYSMERPKKSCEMFEDYKSDYFLRHHSTDKGYSEIQKLLQSNLKLMHEVAVRLPNVYIVDTKKFDPEALPFYLTHETPLNGAAAVVCSNQEHLLQYAMYPKSSVLSMRREKSVFYTRTNLWREACENNGSVLEYLSSCATPDQEPHPQNFLHVLAIVGNSSKLSLPGWMRYGVVNTTQKLLKAYQSNLIDLSVPQEMELMTEFLNEKVFKAWKLNEEMVSVYRRNYSILDFSYVAKMADATDALNIETQLAESRPDLDQVYEANHKYFNLYPINISGFMFGEHDED